MAEETPTAAPEAPGQGPAPEQPTPKGALARPPVLMDATGIQLRNLDDLQRFARMVVEGGSAPDWAFAKCRDDWSWEQRARVGAGAVATAIQAGLEHGLGVLGGLQAFVVLNGVMSWRGQAAAAAIRNSRVCRPGTLKFWSEGSAADGTLKGVAVAHRAGYVDPDRRVFTWADAILADLVKGVNYRKYPGRMLQWRALGLLARDVFSDVLGGFPLAEEAQDFEVPATRSTITRERQARPLRQELGPARPLDPLLADLGVQVLRPKPEPQKAVIDTEAKVAPPFPSHAEADAAIAAEERSE